MSENCDYGCGKPTKDVWYVWIINKICIYLWMDLFVDFKTFSRGLGKWRMNNNESRKRDLMGWQNENRGGIIVSTRHLSLVQFSSVLVLYNSGSLLWLETTSGVTLCSNNKTNIKVPQEGSLNCCTNQGINSCVFSHAIKRWSYFSLGICRL